MSPLTALRCEADDACPNAPTWHCEDQECSATCCNECAEAADGACPVCGEK